MIEYIIKGCIMLKIAFIVTAFIAMTFLGCGSSGGNSELSYDYYVDSSVGDDLNDGSKLTPFKSITHALSVVDINGSVKVNPGVYDNSNGEVFPLRVPEGVTLIGDTENRGMGATQTALNGGGEHPSYDPTFMGTTILMQVRSNISGFVITNTNTADATYPMAVVLIGDNNITIHRNTLTGNSSHVIYIKSSYYHTITENNISNNNGLGLGFIGGGDGSKVENNIITYNNYGVEYDSIGGDLGGGSAGSVGGNIISCNTVNDLWTNTSLISIDAQNNFWDHVPMAGNDIYNGNSADINTSGAAVTANPCL